MRWNFITAAGFDYRQGKVALSAHCIARSIMRANSRSAAVACPVAPKIYYFHPLLAGPREGWALHLDRARDLGFDHVLLAPMFDPGATGDVFLTANHELAHPAFGQARSTDEAVGEFAHMCEEHGFTLFLDVVFGRIAADAVLLKTAPHWFEPGEGSGRVDPRASLRPPGAAYARFADPTIAQELAAWWVERLCSLTKLGVSGYRCEDPQAVPPGIWRSIISSVKDHCEDCRFFAWTPGLDWQAIASLRGVGFAGAFSSVAWWDGRSSWLVEEYELLRSIGVVIGCPEVPFGPRLAKGLLGSPNLHAQFRHLIRRAAATSCGLMIPMGMEFALTTEMDRRDPSDDLAAQHRCKSGFAAEIRDGNALSDKLAALGVQGEMRILTDRAEPGTALLRSSAVAIGAARKSAIVLINPDLRAERAPPISLDPLPAASGAAIVAEEVISGDRDRSLPLGPGEIRVLAASSSTPIKLRRTDSQLAKLASQPRIVIDNVSPAVDEGQFPAKRVIGETMVIEADVFTDGHEMLAAEILWRAADESNWRRMPMQALANDRWQATVMPDRIGRHEFTVEAWWDRFGTFCRDLAVKHKAGADVGVELIEGRKLLEAAKQRTRSGDSKIITSTLGWLADATADASVDIFLTLDLREVMREAEERLFLVRREPKFVVAVERPQALFGNWYELFPRSATDSASRHGTLADVIERLPAIKDMGFDVLYLPPIHPIGTTNRKGKNNSLNLTPNDLGSPYAIGSSEGGHDAIHPALGTIADFRLLRQAAAELGMEIALDFAIQCSPDHPWLKAHPEWFSWRPDGSLRYAENPPKKYQDIVNVDFYAPDAFPGLWAALRDIVLYWAGEGVKIFRVDNPHTKPLPFWEWLITQVHGRHPDVIFLSEAFTRPKIMYRLAKAGFSQSYTYFTWRNTKQELTDYFVELTTTDVKEFFRPHLFVNTPDINPSFLQTSGRPGFLIRAALAATLSGLWGMYSGFELCESAALPGREEYLDSEKYEIRVRDRDAPGNIIAEITALNRIRRSNSALQSHLGLRFYPAHNDQVLFYGKMTPQRHATVLVAVSLDPFHAQDVTIEVPLWEWNLSDGASIGAHDLMSDVSFTWHGKLQRIRLDPARLPFAIWRIAPLSGG